jgi:hypothetical protein
MSASRVVSGRKLRFALLVLSLCSVVTLGRARAQDSATDPAGSEGTPEAPPTEPPPLVAPPPASYPGSQVGSGQVRSGGSPYDTVTEVDPIDIPPEHDPLAHAWDRPGERGGFYLRLTTTLGVQSTHLGPSPWHDDQRGRLAIGFGTGFGLDIGGFIKPWLAASLDAHAGILWNGNLDYDYGRAGYGDRTRVSALGLAPALTFITRRSFYFKSAFGVGFAHIRQPGRDNSTDPGFYMNLAMGKDFYVGDHISFGMQFQIVYMLLGDKSVLDEARVHEYLFGFSMAYDSL